MTFNYNNASFSELKAFVKENNIAIVGDKRVRHNYIVAISEFINRKQHVTAFTQDEEFTVVEPVTVFTQQEPFTVIQPQPQPVVTPAIVLLVPALLVAITLMIAIASSKIAIKSGKRAKNKLHSQWRSLNKPKKWDNPYKIHEASTTC